MTQQEVAPAHLRGGQAGKPKEIPTTLTDCQAESTRGAADVPGRDISFIDFKSLLSKNHYSPQEGGVVLDTRILAIFR